MQKLARVTNAKLVRKKLNNQNTYIILKFFTMVKYKSPKCGRIKQCFKKATCYRLTFTCSKSKIETIQKGVKQLQVNNKNTKTTSCNNIASFSTVSIGNFGKVNVSWTTGSSLAKLMLSGYDFLIENARKLAFSFDSLFKSSVFSIQF